MARARNIKPGLYKNEELVECSIWARYMFPGLWMLADREGRLEDRPKRIKAELLPYDVVDADELLGELESHGFLVRYESAGQKYIQIQNFYKHQNPHHKEAASEIPAPPGHIDSGAQTYRITPGQRQRILDRDGHQCLKCGTADGLQIDHIIPLSKGGTNEDQNLQTLCGRCNSAKGNRNNDSYTDHVRAVDEANKAPDVPLIPDSLNPDTDSLITPPTRTHAKSSHPDPSPEAEQVADILVTASWINDDVGDVARAVERAFSLAPQFNTRDGPLLAEQHVRWRGYAKKPPSDWYQAWLNWIKREAKDNAITGNRSRQNGGTPGESGTGSGEDFDAYVGITRAAKAS